MIKATDLRLGNWVKDLKTKSFTQVDGIPSIFKVITDDARYDDGEREIMPEGIPLTPEMVEPINISLNFMFIAQNFVRDGSGRYEGFIVSIGHWGIDDELKKFRRIYHFLHELQNLYYSLTGTELTIDL